MSIKATIKNIIGSNLYEKLAKQKYNIKNFIDLMYNYSVDLISYYKHSNVFRINDTNKVEAYIILKYHSIEKGMSHEKIRFRFGIHNVKDLIWILKKEYQSNLVLNTQINAALIALRDYYDIHTQNNIDISDYFTIADYTWINEKAIPNVFSTKSHKQTDFFSNCNADFYMFSNSRCSVRNFCTEKIPFSLIEKVIELAKNAPSVCNRQSVKVYYFENKQLIERIFLIQQGLTGYTDKISQLMVVVSDRNFFYTVGERNQLFIDGGIFLMNLLYSLHYYKIGACPAHWGLNVKSDKKIKQLLNLKDSEKVIALVPIGIPESTFKTTLSLRRNTSEILKIVE